MSTASEPDWLGPEDSERGTGRGRRRLAAGAIVVAACAGVGSVGWAVASATTAPGTGTYGSYGYGGPGGAGPDGTQVAHTPHLAGTVKSVSGSTILITDHDGFTRTIRVSASTTYTDDLTANPAVGTKIEAEGTVASDGTSLDATAVHAPKGPAAGGERPGGPGGPGGAVGPGKGGPASTEQPTAGTTPSTPPTVPSPKAS